jgi:2-iminobutanoate/2-iminopropanoate deaminase
MQKGIVISFVSSNNLDPEGSQHPINRARGFQMKKQIIQTANAPAAIGPYSQAVRAGDLLFVSGQIPLDAKSGELIRSGVADETKKVLENLKAIIEAAGGTLADVVKTTIFLKDMSTFSVVNEIYGSYFPQPFPARATVEVARLPRDVNVEIEAIAKLS